MNEIQNKLLEIAIAFVKVCEKLGLSYFAIGGTCLGAIRHQGFIPWDDDIDFCMPRKDYEIFEKEAHKYLPPKYFVQTYKTDKNYIYPFMKIRDSETTAIEDEIKKLKINHGVWIDIFPMDGLPDDFDVKKKIETFDRQFVRRRFFIGGYQKSFLDFVEKLVSIILFPTKRSAIKKSEKLAKKYSINDTVYFWWNWSSRFEHNFKVEWFLDYETVPFESMKIRVPKKYNDYLTEHYGDWKMLPPMEKRVSGHTFSLVDLTKSYKAYYK